MSAARASATLRFTSAGVTVQNQVRVGRMGHGTRVTQSEKEASAPVRGLTDQLTSDCFPPASSLSLCLDHNDRSLCHQIRTDCLLCAQPLGKCSDHGCLCSLVTTSSWHL